MSISRNIFLYLFSELCYNRRTLSRLVIAMTKKDSGAKLSLLLSMTIFGTIGIFRQWIPLPSGTIALVRGAVGTLFLLLLSAIRRRPVRLGQMRHQLPLLCASGAMIGFNWILLFEAYRYTGIPTATLCYYMAPVFVILCSPLVFRERLTRRRVLCATAAVLGMVLVSGIGEDGFRGFTGILYALGAAVLYAGVIVINKLLPPSQDAFDRTVVQLGAGSVVLLPYVLLTESVEAAAFTPTVVALLLVVGAVHTGLAYALYFGAVGALNAVTAALFSYIDPVAAILLSAVLLGDRLSARGAIGAALILGAAIACDLPEKRS